MYDLENKMTCELSTASIGNLEEWKTKFKGPFKYRSTDGMHKNGFNTCHLKEAFNARKGIERPFCWDDCDKYEVDA